MPPGGWNSPSSSTGSPESLPTTDRSTERRRKPSRGRWGRDERPTCVHAIPIPFRTLSNRIVAISSAQDRRLHERSATALSDDLGRQRQGGSLRPPRLHRHKEGTRRDE